MRSCSQIHTWTPTMRETTTKKMTQQISNSKLDYDNHYQYVRGYGNAIQCPSKIYDSVVDDVGEWETHDFKTIYKLGSGSFCDVYYGLWRETPVAIKILKEHIVDKSEFRKEFEILTKLHHPNVLQFFGVSTLLDECALVVELMEGSIHGLNGMNITLHRALEIGIDIARGLAYLHNRTPECVLHRDLKPHNVLLTKSGRAKIADFGISCFQKDPWLLYAMTGHTGTYRYMAPEVIQSRKYNTAVDIFSFAMIMYGLCEEFIPYRYLDTGEIIKSINSGIRPSFYRLKNVSLRHLIVRCWNADPEQRPTAIEVVRQLGNIMTQISNEKTKTCCVIS